MSEVQRTVPASDEHAAEAPLPGPVALAGGEDSRRATSPYSRKFLAVTAALMALAAGAVFLAISILVKGGSSGPQPAWSSFSPPDGGVAGEREIAAEVAPFYRASPASQLVVVTVQDISSNANADTTSGSASDSSSSSSSGGGMQLALRDPTTGALAAVGGKTALYNLCGLGPNCAIAGGTPSSARLLLLRREALELALYTFKYIGGVDNVVAILPPGHTSATGKLTPKPPSPGSTATSSTVNLAVVFQRQSLQHLLDRPLRDTLPEELPPTAAEMPNAPEAELVSVITGQAMFNQHLVQTQDGSNVLVLDPLPPQ